LVVTHIVNCAAWRLHCGFEKFGPAKGIDMLPTARSRGFMFIGPSGVPKEMDRK
jgi:hypothetical protein